jgi:hypothetical protein
MLNYNHEPDAQERFSALIDQDLQRAEQATPKRQYLGASRLGVACQRALQYEYAKAPVDAGREFSGQLLRIFRRGHVMEDCMIDWLRLAGFDLRTEKANGGQFGFSLLDGKLQGHIDGVIVAGHDSYAYPCLWENKCLNSKSWRDLEKNGLAVSKPVYAAQVAIYQAYLQLHEHPALFTAINADNMAIYAEWVPFDAALAQRLSDRALNIISATEAGELLPRGFTESTHVECRFCSWQDRCWQGGV